MPPALYTDNGLALTFALAGGTAANVMQADLEKALVRLHVPLAFDTRTQATLLTHLWRPAGKNQDIPKQRKPPSTEPSPSLHLATGNRRIVLPHYRLWRSNKWLLF